MARLTEQDINEKTIEVPEEEFHLAGYDADVRIRGILDIREQIAVEEKVNADRAGASHSLPHLVGLTDEEIIFSHWISACAIEPTLTVQQVRKMLRQDGASLAGMYTRVLVLCRRTPDVLKQKEAALKADTFPIQPVDAVPEAPSPAAERGPNGHRRVHGDDGVAQPLPTEAS